MINTDKISRYINNRNDDLKKQYGQSEIKKSFYKDGEKKYKDPFEEINEKIEQEIVKTRKSFYKKQETSDTPKIEQPIIDVDKLLELDKQLNNKKK